MPSQRAAKVSRLVTILGSVISLAITTTGCTWLKGSEDRWEATKQAESGKPLQPVAESEMVFILLEQIYADKLNTPDANLLLIEETLPVTKKKSMTFPQDQAAIGRYLKDVNKMCVTNFLKSNKTRHKIDVSGVPGKLQVANISRINQLFNGGGWANVQKTFPHAQAMISVSRAGTCADHNEAIFYLMSTKADGSDEGMLVHAKITGGRWSVIQKAIISQADGL